MFWPFFLVRSSYPWDHSLSMCCSLRPYCPWCGHLTEVFPLVSLLSLMWSVMWPLLWSLMCPFCASCGHFTDGVVKNDKKRLVIKRPKRASKLLSCQLSFWSPFLIFFSCVFFFVHLPFFFKEETWEKFLPKENVLDFSAFFMPFFFREKRASFFLLLFSSSFSFLFPMVRHYSLGGYSFNHMLF